MLFLYILVFIVLLVPTSFLAIEPDPPKLSNVTKRNTPLYLSYYDINGKLIRSIDKRKKMVAITYDDGPSVNTKKILETLNISVCTHCSFVKSVIFFWSKSTPDA